MQRRPETCLVCWVHLSSCWHYSAERLVWVMDACQRLDSTHSRFLKDKEEVGSLLPLRFLRSALQVGESVQVLYICECSTPDDGTWRTPEASCWMVGYMTSTPVLPCYQAGVQARSTS